MEDQLQDFVQHMLDAGASQETIDDGIRLYQSQHAAEAPKLIAADEPDTYLGGALKGFKEGAVGGAKGFAKGVIPGLIDGAKEIVKSPITLGKGVVDAGIGAYHMATDPVGTSKSAIDSMASIPGKVRDMASAAAQKAAVDPEGFGNDVGRLTGTAEAGILAGKVVPLAPKPIARQIGAITEQVGTKGAWPLRMMGAHQLGSGNPMGLVTMASPEMLQKSGRAMQKFGGVDGVTTLPSGGRNIEVKGPIRTYAAEPAQSGAVSTSRIPYATPAPRGPRTLAENLDAAVASGELRRAADFPEMGQKTPSIQERQSGSIRVGSKAPTPIEKFLADDPQARMGGEGRMTGQFEEGSGGLSDAMAGRLTPQSQAARNAAAVAEAKVQQPAFTDKTAIESGRKLNQRLREGKPPEGVVERRQATSAGGTGQPRPADAPNSGRIATQDAIPASKSKSAMSATPGLTRADLEAVGGNPDVNYKTMTPEMAAKIKSLRSSRHGTNYANAQTDKSLRAGKSEMMSLLEQSLLERLR